MTTTTALSFRLDHVALRVNDLDTAISFYTEALGFTLTQQWPHGELLLAFLTHGEITLELLGGGTPEPHPRARELGTTFSREGIHHLCLAVDDLEAAIAELGGRGVPLLGEPMTVEAIGRRIAFVQDPFGHLLELSATT